MFTMELIRGIEVNFYQGLCKFVDMRQSIIGWCIGLCLFLVTMQVLGQERDVTIDVGKSRLTMQDELIYQITIENGQTRSKPSLIDFPALPGFKKDLQKRTFPIIFEEGRRRRIDVIQQKYLPLKPGSFQFPQFQILVDDQSFALAPRRVQVIDSIPGLSVKLPKLVGNEAFLATTVSVPKAFVGEEVVLEIALYIPKQTSFEWDFPSDLSAQIERMAQRIKPLDCLENREVLSSVTAEDVNLKNQNFTKYRLFLSRYIPLKAGTFVFPTVEFKPLRKVRGEAEFKAVFLKSSREMVAIELLPDHPLRDKVSVGAFQWTEKVNPKQIEVGKPVTYEARIQGSSSLGFATWPAPASDEWFDFFPESSTSKSLVGPTRTFRFQIIPKKAGKVSLGSYFQFFFFNPVLQEYDTLKSSLDLVVQGDSITNLGSKSRSIDVYDGLRDQIIPDRYVNMRYWSQIIANFCIFAIFVVAIFIFYNRSNQKP